MGLIKLVTALAELMEVSQARSSPDRQDAAHNRCQKGMCSAPDHARIRH